jgi:general secretion pathway protein G
VEGTSRGRLRKDRFLVPINPDFDLYSMGKGGRSVGPLTTRHSREDIVRASNGRFVGLAEDY